MVPGVHMMPGLPDAGQGRYRRVVDRITEVVAIICFIITAYILIFGPGVQKSSPPSTSITVQTSGPDSQNPRGR